MATGFDVNGSPSATVAGQSGKQHRVTGVYGWFTGGGTGTLYLKEGSTTVWSASVSGGFEFHFPSGRSMAAGASVTLSLSGGNVWLLGQTE